jgi:hypothetical protein
MHSSINIFARRSVVCETSRCFFPAIYVILICVLLNLHQLDVPQLKPRGSGICDARPPEGAQSVLRWYRLNWHSFSAMSHCFLTDEPSLCLCLCQVDTNTTHLGTGFMYASHYTLAVSYMLHIYI